VSSFYRPLIEQLATLPGVESAGAISHLPMQSNSNTLYDVPGQEAPSPQQRPLAEFRFITPGYLQTMDISSVQGRNFDERDRPDTRSVVIVNEMLANLHWPNEDPIGKQVEFWGGTREIVGIVENTIIYDQVIRPMIFMSAFQAPRLTMSVVVHTSGEPTALVEEVRNEVSSLDPNLPLYQMMSMEQVVSESRQLDTLMAKMMAAMAAVALVLSVAGVYGVISYSVAQRTQEMGIRMALGARNRSVLGLVLRQGAVLTAVGIAIGLITASLIARGMSLWLFGVSPFDIVSFGSSITILLAASVAASYFPARRVARLDPLKVLRYE
jgi:putative ABC transport system permease protein